MAGGGGICASHSGLLEQDGIWDEPGWELLGGIMQQDPGPSAKNTLILNIASADGAGGAGNAALSRVLVR